MTMTSVAKFSAIYMLVAVLAGTTAAFWPADEGGFSSGDGMSTTQSILR